MLGYMRLYLVQHAEAQPEEVDPTRGLTPEGVGHTTKMARFLSEAGLTVDEVLHSGKTRAAQTAVILAAYLTVTRGVFDADGLSPNDDPGIWADRLTDRTGDTMLVGHLPHLARLAALLLCGKTGEPMITFANAGVVCLSRSEGKGWSLEWMVTPRIIVRE